MFHAVVFVAVIAQSESADRPVLSRGAVDYWGTARTVRVKKPSEPRESVWVEPVRTSDGRTMLHVPPRAVLDFLDDPTEATASAYLTWQRERMWKLRRAMEVLETIAHRESKPAPAKDSADGPVELLYFKQANCPWCDAQDRVLAALPKDRPALAVRTIDRTRDPDLWRKHSVEVTPTIVVRAGDTTVATLRGLAPADAILGALNGRSK